MSLANFFDKAALGASSILKNFDRQAFADSLQQKTVGICFDSQAVDSPEAAVALELTVNLLARLYPRLAIRVIGESARSALQRILKEARQINPEIEITDIIEECVICVVIGKSSPEISASKVYIGSEGWIARISTQNNLDCGNSNNPFGAAAAACIAVANVFRHCFADQLEVPRLDAALTLSLVDLDPSTTNPANPPFNEIDFRETHLVGIGAIGNGAVWVLRKLQNLTGTLHLIDHESVDLSNLQRYALAGQIDIGVPKVEIASRNWRTGLTIRPQELRWAEYLRQRGQWNIERVAVALDSAADRCAVQAALPQFVINSWTRGGNFGVSRHSFLGNQACLVCMYLPDGHRKNEDELIAEAIGLPNAFREIRHLLYYNNPINTNLLNRIAQALNLDPKDLAAFDGKSIRSFYTEAVCGGILLRLGNCGKSETVEVPMAFQSVFAGIQLAAELVIDACKLRESFPTVTQIDVLKPMGTFLSASAPKDPLQRCICQDKDYISAFQKKYPSGQHTSD